MNESEWNQAIFDAFFGEEWAQRAVYLCVDEEALEAVGQAHGIARDHAVEDFENAVRSRVRPRGNPLSAWTADLEQWKAVARPVPPPFIALLGATVLAASRQVVGAAGGAPNYYLQMNRLLGRTTGVETAYRDLIPLLWKELSFWLSPYWRGDLGLPTARAPETHHQKIGFSVSQALLSGNDRERLGHFFLAAGFAPGATFEPAELVARLRQWSRSGGNVTQRLVRMLDDPDLRDQVGDIIASELRSWDGTIRTREGHRVLQVVITMDPKRNSVGTALKLPVQNPPVDVIVDHRQHNVGPDLPFLRLPVQVDGDLLANGVRIPDRKMRMVYRPRRVVPLVPNDDLGGWSSVERAELDVQHCVLVHESIADQARFLMVELGGQPAPITKVPLPDGWQLFRGYRPTRTVGRADSELMPLVPGASELARLVGGLRVVPGQPAYLVGGAPDLVVPGVASHVLELMLDDERLPPVGDEGQVLALEDLGMRAGEHRITVGSQPLRIELLQQRVEIPRREMILAHHLIRHGELVAATGPAVAADELSRTGCALLISGAAIDVLADDLDAIGCTPPRMIKALATKGYLALGQPGEVAELVVEQPLWAKQAGLSFNSFEVEDHETRHGFSFLFVVRKFRDWHEVVGVRNSPIRPGSKDPAALSNWARTVTELASQPQRFPSFTDTHTQQRWDEYADLALRELDSA